MKPQTKPPVFNFCIVNYNHHLFRNTQNQTVKTNSPKNPLHNKSQSQSLLPPPTPLIRARIAHAAKTPAPFTLYIQRPIQVVRAIGFEAGQGSTISIIVGIPLSHKIEQVLLKSHGEVCVGGRIGVGAVEEGICDVVGVEGGGDVEEVVVDFPGQGAGEVGAVAVDTDFGYDQGGALEVGGVG